ncbi:MAG: hypothetical protein P4L50_04330 [Anaerolineaceae bacterium]|nr:hypothetical protein [Anaerolineaceae bacterium]
MANSLDEYLNEQQSQLIASLSSPAKIQAYLDSIPYSAEEANRSPLRVLSDCKAHCLDGGVFAAAVLRGLGHPPIILDMQPDPGMDDDHVLAIYQRGGFYGAVAKSNFSGLRFREPVYRSLRELVMSYFEVFFNVQGIKTLRGYTRPINLAAYDKQGWMWQDSGVDYIEKRLKELKLTVVATPEMAGHFSPVDQRSYQAGMLGVNSDGLYKPKA